MLLPSLKLLLTRNSVNQLGRHFPNSQEFRRLDALITATHAMSSYSLTLQHGVPFQPVNIRVSSDPISLIEKILGQNPGSYAKLQDLLSIGRNMVAAGLTTQTLDDDEHSVKTTPVDLEAAKDQAQRRIVGMAIEAALQEDDFETAYSYVVNSLDTTRATTNAPESVEDDVAWRAALAAGKHKSSPPVTLRRLDQRLDLLSQALLLAPPSALPEILSAWRKCEEEMTALLASESPDATPFDADAPDLPGAFEEAAPVQARREIGRGAGEEAPVGLFDVARGAARAFSKTAFPLHGAAMAANRTSAEGGRPASMIESDAGSEGADGQRVRKRDMVANAVTGSLASGLGWVLGKLPARLSICRGTNLNRGYAGATARPTSVMYYILKFWNRNPIIILTNSHSTILGITT
jgi:protein transport protein SEC39